LLNDINAKAGNSVRWTGGINNPHEDLVMALGDRGIGVQIKNSAKELEKLNSLKVAFASRQVANFANL
jgi:hypothetical protein